MSSFGNGVSFPSRVGSSLRDGTLSSTTSASPSSVVAASPTQQDPILAMQDEVFGKSHAPPPTDTMTSLAGIRARRQHLCDAESRQRDHFEGLSKQLRAVCLERNRERGVRPDLPALVCDRRPLVKAWSKQGWWPQKVHSFCVYLLDGTFWFLALFYFWCEIYHRQNVVNQNEIIISGRKAELASKQAELEDGRSRPLPVARDFAEMSQYTLPPREPVEYRSNPFAVPFGIFGRPLPPCDPVYPREEVELPLHRSARLARESAVQQLFAGVDNFEPAFASQVHQLPQYLDTAFQIEAPPQVLMIESAPAFDAVPSQQLTPQLAAEPAPTPAADADPVLKQLRLALARLTIECAHTPKASRPQTTCLRVPQQFGRPAPNLVPAAFTPAPRLPAVTLLVNPDPAPAVIPEQVIATPTVTVPPAGQLPLPVGQLPLPAGQLPLPPLAPIPIPALPAPTPVAAPVNPVVPPTPVVEVQPQQQAVQPPRRRVAEPVKLVFVPPTPVVNSQPQQQQPDVQMTEEVVAAPAQAPAQAPPVEVPRNRVAAPVKLVMVPPTPVVNTQPQQPAPQAPPRRHVIAAPANLLFAPAPAVNTQPQQPVAPVQQQPHPQQQQPLDVAMTEEHDTSAPAAKRARPARPDWQPIKRLDPSQAQAQLTLPTLALPSGPAPEVAQPPMAPQQQQPAVVPAPVAPTVLPSPPPPAPPVPAPVDIPDVDEEQQAPAHGSRPVAPMRKRRVFNTVTCPPPPSADVLAAIPAPPPFAPASEVEQQQHPAPPPPPAPVMEEEVVEQQQAESSTARQLPPVRTDPWSGLELRSLASRLIRECVDIDAWRRRLFGNIETYVGTEDDDLELFSPEDAAKILQTLFRVVRGSDVGTQRQKDNTLNKVVRLARKEGMVIERGFFRHFFLVFWDGGVWDSVDNRFLFSRHSGLVILSSATQSVWEAIGWIITTNLRKCNIQDTHRRVERLWRTTFASGDSFGNRTIVQGSWGLWPWGLFGVLGGPAWISFRGEMPSTCDFDSDNHQRHYLVVPARDLVVILGRQSRPQGM
ncbi:hypothetical protein B0T21DRAFT_344845 [Apiosordaria backusii]|uniref:Uncharacterized protein n=1 Tax=Apiosordaria backusii TaxID=314023 RepID=A0AA40ESN8_9PEZI|nr:hypothetical protein B0T21DRAFT_344845 [Apiosordaria backusii]